MAVAVCLSGCGGGVAAGDTVATNVAPMNEAGDALADDAPDGRDAGAMVCAFSGGLELQWACVGSTPSGWLGEAGTGAPGTACTDTFDCAPSCYTCAGFAMGGIGAVSACNDRNRKCALPEDVTCALATTFGGPCAKEE